MSSPILSVRDLSVAFARARIRCWRSRPGFVDVAPGENVALVGESGSGKSVTALRW